MKRAFVIPLYIDLLRLYTVSGRNILVSISTKIEKCRSSSSFKNLSKFDGKKMSFKCYHNDNHSLYLEHANYQDVTASLFLHHFSHAQTGCANY